MKNVDLDRLLMWKNLRQYLQTKNAIWSINSAFAGAEYALSQAILRMESDIEEQQKNTTGVTAQRTFIRNSAVTKVALIARCAEAYAANAGDMDLYTAVHVQPSRLSMLRNGEQAGKMKTILDRASAHSAELVAYGLGEELFAGAYAAVAALRSLTQGSRNAITGRANATLRIRVVIRDGMAAVKQMDRLVNVIALRDPDFGSGYQTARIVAKSSGRHRKDDEQKAA